MPGLTVHAGSRSPPAPDVCAHMLRSSEQRLLEMVRRVGFGSIGRIRVRQGELILGTGIRTRRRQRLGGTDRLGAPPRPTDDFKLKRHHRELIEAIRGIERGAITITIQNGLPLEITVEEVTNC